MHVNRKEGGISPVVRSVVWAGGWAMFPWSVQTSSGAWHNHVELVGEREGRHAPLTLEDYHVTRVLGYNVEKNLVYFKGSGVIFFFFLFFFLLLLFCIIIIFTITNISFF